MRSMERKFIWRETHPVAIIAELYRSISAHVAELVDAHGSGPCAARCGGSSPSVGTTNSAKKPPSVSYRWGLFSLAAHLVQASFSCKAISASSACSSTGLLRTALAPASTARRPSSSALSRSRSKARLVTTSSTTSTVRRGPDRAGVPDHSDHIDALHGRLRKRGRWGRQNRSLRKCGSTIKREV